MMKQFLSLFMGALLLAAVLSGRGKKAPEPSELPETTAAPTEKETEAPTTVPTEPAVLTEEKAVLADHVPAVLAFLNRGDTLEVVCDYDDQYVKVKLSQGYGLAAKNLIRMEGAEGYEAWDGYSVWNAEIYDNFHLAGEPAEKLSQNVKVRVLEDLGTCLMIEKDGKTFYADSKKILKWPVSGGGAGSNGGGQDGGDITMGGVLQVSPLSAITQEGEISGTATVLADQVPVILGFFDRGEGVPAVIENGQAEEKEGFALLCYDGIYSYMEEQFLRSGKAYEPWEGYCTGMAKVYQDFYLTGDSIPNIWANVKLHEIEEFKDVYLVEVNDVTGYILKTGVSRTPVAVAPGGGTGGGNQEWSDPVL